ncbi:MAG: terpene cyclase/mutase family protein [Gemmatales bacterium]|nr:terpene cyclase/mutase family protein [Gemmatales bacterium]MDW8385978.1 terpene cyclase/mutase family protein [Gemmatales bacterium]
MTQMVAKVWNARSLVAPLMVSVLCAFTPDLAVPQEPPRAAEVVLDDAAKRACDRALEWLASRQNSDGSWSETSYPHNTAITSFALLAFMSQGHLPNQGLYGPEVAKGMRFLLSSAREKDGYLIGSRGGNMYCHAMATLALAELWGMTGDDDIKPVLDRAVNLIIGSQSDQGGWRYEPNQNQADISVTIMQVMALRAAKNSGLHVPDQTLKDALAYIQRCYDARSGGFTYQPGSRGPGFARTAAGVCVLQLSGKYDAEQIPRAVQFMKSQFNTRQHFWYGHYYAAHAMHQVGGPEWEEWYAKIRALLLARQSPDGSWSTRDLDYNTPGPVYQTSVGVIILSVPTHYLPIFQR